MFDRTIQLFFWAFFFAGWASGRGEVVGENRNLLVEVRLAAQERKFGTPSQFDVPRLR